MLQHVSSEPSTFPPGQRPRDSAWDRGFHMFKFYLSLATGGQSVWNHRLRPQLMQLAAAGQTVNNHSCTHQVLNWRLFSVLAMVLPTRLWQFLKNCHMEPVFIHKSDRTFTMVLCDTFYWLNYVGGNSQKKLKHINFKKFPHAHLLLIP